MNTPKPGDFSIGSVESRAAMRLQLSKESEEVYVEFVSCIPRPWRGEGPEPKDWNKVPRIDDGNPRILYVPTGMTTAEARKILWPHRPLPKTLLTFGGSGPSEE